MASPIEIARTAAAAPVLDERSKHLRSLVVRALEGGGRGHVGSSMSLIEILRVLYDDVLRFRPADPKWPDRDRIILSKGHGCLALYAMLADKGFIGADSLAFVSIDGLYRAMGESGRNPAAPKFCDACFTGDYPIPLVDHDAGKVSTQLSLLAETA